MTKPQPEIADTDLQYTNNDVENSQRQFVRKYRILFDDQIKRKQIIDQIQTIANTKNYDLSGKPRIANETYKFEWFVAAEEPSLVDSLYYLYFWVLLKGKYLLDDISDESIMKLKKKKSFYNEFESPLKAKSSIENHHSHTRFEVDILKAQKSVGDLRSQFAKIIKDEGSSPLASPRKPNFGDLLTPTSSPIAKKFATSPVTKKFAASPTTKNFMVSPNSLSINLTELNLVESPFIKNVLRFKFEVSGYLTILVDHYNLTNKVLPLGFLLDTLPSPKILLKNQKINCDIAKRLPGYQYLWLIAENPIDKSCDPHLHFVHQLLIDHLDCGLVWDFHSIYQTTGKLSSDINIVDRAEKFQSLNKTLNNLLLEFYKNRAQREDMIKHFNLDGKNVKINGLKFPNFKFQSWKTWNELDFILLNNYIIKSGNESRLQAKQQEFKLLQQGQTMTYYAWDSDTNKQIEKVYTKS